MRSLNGTLSGTGYAKDTRARGIMMNMGTQCPEGLTRYQSSPVQSSTVPALRCKEALHNSYRKNDTVPMCS